MLVCTSSDRLATRKSLLSALSYVIILMLLLVRRLKPLDIEIMKRLGTRVNLIPVVAKADTLTQNDLFLFKQRVRTYSYHWYCVSYHGLFVADS